MGSPLTAGRGRATTMDKRGRDLGLGLPHALGRGPGLEAARAIGP